MLQDQVVSILKLLQYNVHWDYPPWGCQLGSSLCSMVISNLLLLFSCCSFVFFTFPCSSPPFSLGSRNNPVCPSPPPTSGGSALLSHPLRLCPWTLLAGFQSLRPWLIPPGSISGGHWVLAGPNLDCLLQPHICTAKCVLPMLSWSAGFILLLLLFQDLSSSPRFPLLFSLGAGLQRIFFGGGGLGGSHPYIPSCQDQTLLQNTLQLHLLLIWGLLQLLLLQE